MSDINPQQQIEIGQACDGFSIIIDDEPFICVNQEDDQAKAIKKFLIALGFTNVTTFEDY